jgi:hypothetical protein
VITAFLALVATLWTGATAEALTRTAAASDSVVMVAGRTFVTSSSIRLWLAAGAGAVLVALWCLTVWSFARRRARRASAVDFADETAADRILLGRVGSMQLRVEELQERVRHLTDERAVLRRELQRTSEYDRVVLLEGPDGPGDADVLHARLDPVISDLDVERREREPS